MRPMTRFTAGVTALALAGAAAAAAQAIWIRVPKVHVVVPHIHVTPQMRGGGRPGPDSAMVSGFLASLGHADATVCEMAVNQLGNSWGNWGGGAQNGLRDRTEADRTAQARLGGSVSDARRSAMVRSAPGTSG